MTEIWVAIISAIATIIAVVITTRQAAAKQTAEFKADIAVMNNRIDELTREVREHNNFARRMPVLEEKVSNIEKRIEKGD